MIISIDKMKRVIIRERLMNSLTYPEHASTIGISLDEYTHFMDDYFVKESIGNKVSNYIIKKYGRRCILK